MRSVKMIFAVVLLLTGLGLFAGAYVMTFDRSNTYGLIMLGVVALFAAAQMIASLLGLTWRDTGSSDSGTDLFSGDNGDGD